MPDSEKPRWIKSDRLPKKSVYVIPEEPPHIETCERPYPNDSRRVALESKIA